MIRLAVRCRPEQAERVLAELLELAPGGVEEDLGEGYVEYAIYGPPGELPELPDLEAAAGGDLVAIETTEIPDDWADRWRDFHRPVRVGERLVVLPSWELTDAPSAEIEIVIDPGRAFGTGAHATTSLCLGLLVELADRGAGRGAVSDLGTGSGVLAIAAARLGFGPIYACDHEPPAVEAAIANAELNRVGPEISVERLNLREQPIPTAPLWLANLTAPVLLEVTRRMPSQLPATLILSGMLGAETEGVATAFEEHGYETEQRLLSGDWAALRLGLGSAD